MKQIFTVIILLTLSSISALSQSDTLVLTLGDALEIANAQSADALMAKHRFRISYWQYKSYRADYLPSVNISAQLPNLNHTYETVTQDSGPSYQYNAYETYSADLSINQKIGWTGGSVYLSSHLGRLDNTAYDSTVTSYISEPITIGYRQPIFQYNEYRWASKIEPIKYEKAKREYLENLEQVSINTINHFFNLLSAQIDRQIAEKNLNNYDTLYKIAQGRYQLGKIAENDLLQLELNYLRAKAAVDNASLNYQNMAFRLKSYLRLKQVPYIKLLAPATNFPESISTEEAVAQANQNTSTAIDFQERLLTAQSEVRQAKMNGRFDADLHIEYGLTNSTPQISEVYKNPSQNQILSLGLSAPILDWGRARGQINVAESNYELEQTSVEQDLIDFEQNIFLNVMQFNMQQNQLFIAAKADTVAQKRYDVTQKRYMIGQVNDVLELNNAQIDNDNARKGYYDALRNYWVNYYQLRKMTLYDFINNKMLIFDIRDIM